MSDFRVRYGSAIGPYGTAAAVSGAMSFGIDDSTPDVSLGTFFRTANTGATTITYFDVLEPQGNTSTSHNGKWFTLLAADNLTTIANAGQIFRSGTGGAMTSGQTISFVYFNSGWYEAGASAEVGGREAVKTVTVTGNAAPNVSGVKVLLLSGTGGMTISGFSGGVVGQSIDVGKALVAAGSVLTFTGAANFMLSGTGVFTLSDSAFYRFVCDNGTRFRQVGGANVP